MLQTTQKYFVKPCGLIVRSGQSALWEPAFQSHAFSLTYFIRIVGRSSLQLSVITEKDDIIVFRHYDTVIDANIAKTKLDAYDVPCFLTEENMSNLYPGQPFMAFKVRLHLFAKDEEKAHVILESQTQMSTDSDHSSRCPKCLSLRITRDFPKEESDSLTFLFFGVLFPHRKVNHCLDCDNEF
jgi:hypothetical protein